MDDPHPLPGAHWETGLRSFRSFSVSCSECERGSKQFLIFIVLSLSSSMDAARYPIHGGPGRLSKRMTWTGRSTVQHASLAIEMRVSAIALMPALALRPNCFLSSFPSRSALLATKLVMALSHSSICALFPNCKAWLEGVMSPGPCWLCRWFSHVGCWPTTGVLARNA